MSAHYWAREIAKFRHQVRLMSPRFVRRYAKSNKNDAKDAEAICEAVARPSMRSVAIKNRAQQDMLALHRVRSLLIRERTALMNEMHGPLAEFGVCPQGSSALRRLIVTIVVETDDRLSDLPRESLAAMNDRLRFFEERLKHYDRRIAGLARGDQRAERLMAVPRVGPVTAAARIASVGDARRFRNGRAERLVGVGSATALERGADCAIWNTQAWRSIPTNTADSWCPHHLTLPRVHARFAQPLGCSGQRKTPNVAAVALANKDARALWALLARADEYRVAAVALQRNLPRGCEGCSR